MRKKDHGSFLYSANTTIFAFSCFSYKHIFEIFFTTGQILKWIDYNASQFDLKKTTRQILTWKFYNLSDFKLKNLKKSVFGQKKNTTRQILKWKRLLVRFWNLKKAQSVRVWNKILLEVRCRIGKLQRIRFWKKFFTRQILHFVVKKSEPDFEFEMFRHLGFQKSLHTKIELLFYSMKTINLQFLCFS